MTIFISFIIFYHLTTTSIKAYSQSDIINSTGDTKFLNYIDPSAMIKIKYPSFWQKPIALSNDTISFISPVNTIGIIIQNTPILRVSIDEISLNMIKDIKNSFPNVKILNMSISNSTDNSLIHKLEFTYGITPDTFRELQVTKLTEGRSYKFIYYADNSLFNQFYPIASVMFNSLQTPKFTNTFSQEQTLNQIKLNAHDNQTIKNTDSVSPVTNVSIASKQNNPLPNLTNISIFDNKLLGIKLQYPKFLSKLENDKGVLFVSNNKSIGVTIMKMPLNNISEIDFTSNHILSLNNTLKNFNIINSSTSDLLGYPTQMILFSYNNVNQLYKGLEFWKVAENHAYIFTFYAQSERLFDDFLPLITKMIESLRIVE